MNQTPVLVLMCAGLATRWARMGTVQSIESVIQEGTMWVPGSKISGYAPDKDELTQQLSPDKGYVVKGKPGKLIVCGPNRVKNLAQAFEEGPRLVEYDMAEFYKFGGKEVVLVVSHKNKRYFEEVFGKDKGGHNYNGLTIKYAFQSKDPDAVPRGTSEAVLAAFDLVGERSVIGINGDDIYPNGFRELLKPENAPRNDTEIVTLGYQLCKIIPKNSTGHTLGVLKTDDNGMLTACTEYEKLYWLDENTIQDKDTEHTFHPSMGASMNILTLPPGAYERLKKAHESMPYGNPEMMKKWFNGRTEFLIPHFLGMVPGMDDISCRVISFGMPRYGLTSNADLPEFSRAVIEFYHRGDKDKSIW